MKVQAGDMYLQNFKDNKREVAYIFVMGNINKIDDESVYADILMIYDHFEYKFKQYMIWFSIDSKFNYHKLYNACDLRR